MTEKYVLTSHNFEGELELEFDSNGILKVFKNNAELNEAQLNHLTNNFPCTVQSAKDLIAKSTSLVAQHIPADVTFEQFWNMYNHKAYSNKIISEKVFEKMSLKERLQDVEYIRKYENLLKLQQGVAKKYAETYLRSRVWDR